MSRDAAQFETKVVRVLRGTEDKSVAKWEAEGWELAGESCGRVRTELSFRRPKPKMPRRAIIALTGMGVVAASALTIGAILEDPEESESPAATSTSEEQDPAASAPPTRTVSAWDSSSREFRFGETASYVSTAGPNNTPLEITVNGPVHFEPSPDADLYFIEYGRGAPEFGLANIYFDVTIKNLSNDEAYGTEFVTPRVYQGASDEHFPYLRDHGIDGAGGREIPPGGELVFKQGFSVNYVDTIRLEIRIDGLAGTTLFWDQRGQAPKRP